MDAEIASLQANNTWTLEPPPAGANIIKGRWVFTLKTGADGHIARYKARWVAKGFTQRKGVDYDDTYASVTKSTSIKLLLGIVAHYDLEAKQYDIITAFLNAKLKEFKIYVEQPHGYEQSSGGGTLVCKLLRALYGLKQSPLLWFEELTTFLIERGFLPLKSDPCIFQQKNTGVLIAVYVDDLIMASQQLEAINEAEQLLKDQFKMHSLGDTNFYLGCRIIRDRANKAIYLTQDGFIQQLLEKYHMDNVRAVSTPMDVNFKLQESAEDYVPEANLLHEYQSLVGRLMWPSLQTRPDITFTLTAFSRHLVKPLPEHLNELKRVLRYLKGTINHGIKLQGTDQQHLTISGFTDSSFADDKGDSKSTAGYAFMVNNTGLISWKSAKQRIVTLSTAEAEFTAATVAAQEAAYIAGLMNELLLLQGADVRSIIIHTDNRSAIDLAHKVGVDGRSKHMNVRLHWLRQQILDGSIHLTWTPTDCQAADGLTKPLSKPKHEQFKALVGMVDCTGVLQREVRSTSTID